MASENKTQATKVSVSAFLNSIEDKERRKDAKSLLKLFKTITGEKAVMWGPSIIGFGEYHYRYDSGREGDFIRTGFSPRKSNLSVYLIDGFDDKQALLEKLGKHKLGRSCLYINRLSDIDEKVLIKLIKQSYTTMNKRYRK
jgi:hypothetical protein